MESTKPNLDELGPQPDIVPARSSARRREWTTTDIMRGIGGRRTTSRSVLELVAQPGFPEPIGRLGNYTLWWRPEVEGWVVSGETHSLAA